MADTLNFKKIALWLGLAALVSLPLVWVFGWSSALEPIAVVAVIGIAWGIGGSAALRSYQYTAWIIAAIVCGMLYPQAFLKWGEFDLRNKWVVLVVVQLVMFGMGTQMSLKDLANVRSMGKGVLVGILCQFSIMPLVGYGLTRVFHFEPEIAAGIILIGSCSSGLASNVMVYLAKATLTLSVTLTAVATLLAPVMTPFWMKVLAGTYVEVNFWDMCIQIVQIVIVPIGAAMLYDVFKSDNTAWKRALNLVVIIACIWFFLLLFGGGQYIGERIPEGAFVFVELFSFLLGAVVVGKWYYLATTFYNGIRNWMPVLSMFGIVYFTVVTTAASRENILAVGLLMLLVSILHNSLGYLLGYSFSRLLGMNKNDCRTIALEVGLQNGGMASGLAGGMGKLATLGLAAAVFSPWMNISGSLLGNFWRRRGVKEH